jgi:hypothetical protein
MHLDLIVGLPLDHWEDIKFSFEEVFKLFAPELQLGFLKFLKGTPVREKYAQHGYVFDPNPPYQIIESNYLSKDQLAQIVKLEEALEIYWNKDRASNTLKYATANYSIFDFMLGLGKHFDERYNFHKHTIIDVYTVLYDFAATNYPEDHILKQLITADYYLQAKVKPKPLFVEEIQRPEKSRLIESLHLNHHKFRYVILPFDFDFHLFTKQNIISETSCNLIIQYDGTSKAEVIIPETLNILQN